MPRCVTNSPRVEREIGKIAKAAKKAARDAGKNGKATQHERERAQIEAMRGKKGAKV